MLSFKLKKTQNQIKYLNDITDFSIFETLDKLSDEKFVKCLKKYTEHFEFIESLRYNKNKTSSELIILIIKKLFNFFGI